MVMETTQLLDLVPFIAVSFLCVFHFFVPPSQCVGLCASSKSIDASLTIHAKFRDSYGLHVVSVDSHPSITPQQSVTPQTQGWQN